MKSKKLVLIHNFPEFRQAYTYDCGASAMESVLAYFGFDVREEEILKIAGTVKKGTALSGLKKVAKKFGLKFKEGKMNIALLKKYIDEGKPAIIVLQAWRCEKVTNWKKHWDEGHYVVPIGYGNKKFYFADPACFVRTYLSFDELDKRWHDTDGKKIFEHWGILFYGKKPKYSLDKAVHMDFDSYHNSGKLEWTYKRYKKIK